MNTSPSETTKPYSLEAYQAELDARIQASGDGALSFEGLPIIGHDDLVKTLEHYIDAGDGKSFLKIIRAYRNDLDTPAIKWQEGRRRVSIELAEPITDELRRLRNEGNIEEAEFLVKILKKFGIEVVAETVEEFEYNPRDRGPFYDR